MSTFSGHTTRYEEHDPPRRTCKMIVAKRRCVMNLPTFPTTDRDAIVYHVYTTQILCGATSRALYSEAMCGASALTYPQRLAQLELAPFFLCHGLGIVPVLKPYYVLSSLIRILGFFPLILNQIPVGWYWRSPTLRLGHVDKDQIVPKTPRHCAPCHFELLG